MELDVIISNFVTVIISFQASAIALDSLQSNVRVVLPETYKKFDLINEIKKKLESTTGKAIKLRPQG